MMKILKLLSCSILCLTLFACSSTTKQSTFKKFEKFNVEKTSYNSDHQRMLSLINRPVPKDQVMMLAFAQQRMNEANYPYFNGVEIRGNKIEDPMLMTQNTVYSKFIVNDVNAININGPQKSL